MHIPPKIPYPSDRQIDPRARKSLKMRADMRNNLVALVVPFQLNTSLYVDPVVEAAEASALLDTDIYNIIHKLGLLIDQLTLESRTIGYGYKCGAPVMQWHFIDSVELAAGIAEDQDLLSVIDSTSEVGGLYTNLSQALVRSQKQLTSTKSEILSATKNLHSHMQLLMSTVDEFTQLLERRGSRQWHDSSRTAAEDEQTILDSYNEVQRVSWGLFLIIKFFF